MIQRCLILLLTVLCLGASNVSARVCFLPDSEDCGQGNTNMPEANSTVIPCDHKDCNDTSWYNKTYEECYKSGVCAYKRCKLNQEECEKTRQKNEECNYDADTGCYYTKKIDKCSPLYNRTQNDIHGDCKECVDKQGSHWYCQYNTCNDLYPGSSPNPTCQDGTTKKKIGKSLKEGDCYICSTDPNAETCDTYQDEEKIGIDRGCWECKPCPSDRTKFKCTQKIREGYEIKNGVCQISSQTQTCNPDVGEYVSKDFCQEGYYDKCYDCDNNVKCDLDTTSKCYKINCSTLTEQGFDWYDDQRQCEESTHQNCKLDKGFGCYYSETVQVTCQEKDGLFATEAECEKFGIGGSARCTKENNCYRPDEFRIIVDWDGDPDDAFGNADFFAFVLTNGSSTIDIRPYDKSAYANISSSYSFGKMYSVNVGTYKIKIRGAHMRYVAYCEYGACEYNTTELLKSCRSYTSALPTSVPNIQDLKCQYIENFEMTDADGNKLASFDPRNQKDGVDYPLTLEPEACAYYYGSSYGENYTKTIATPSYTSTYTFKGGITYYVNLPTKSLNSYYKCLEIK